MSYFGFGTEASTWEVVLRVMKLQESQSKSCEG